MKTIKIKELTHQQITELQNYIYKKTGTKFNFDHIISEAIMHETTTLALKYNDLRGATVAFLTKDLENEEK